MGPPDVAALEPDTVLAVAAIAIALEKIHAEAHAATGSKWPEGCCVEASLALRDELDARVPEAGATYVWGEFVVATYADGREVEFPLGHAWVELADGTIVDMTAGQFLARRDPALAVIRRGEPMARYYRALERPVWA